MSPVTLEDHRIEILTKELQELRDRADHVLAELSQVSVPAAAPQRAAPDELPFAGYDQVASSKRTESKRLLDRQDLDTLQATLTYERQHRNRSVVIGLIEAAIARKQQAAAPRQPAPSRARGVQELMRATGDELPFPEYAQVASSKETQSRKVLAARSVDELQAALEFERAHQNRNKIIRLIETQLRKKGAEPPAAAAPAATAVDTTRPPFRQFNQLASSKQTQSRRILARRSVEELQAALAYEKANRNRVQIIRLIEDALDKAQQPELELPFAGYDQVASSKQTESKRLLAKHDVDTLRRAREYETATRNRRQVLGMIDDAIARASGAAAPAPAARPQAETAAADLPFPEYAQVASSKGTLSRRILAQRTPEELEQALAYEKANRNRAQIVRMIETQLRKKGKAEATAPAAAPAAPAAADLPFPEYAQVASKRETQSRAILAQRTPEELQAALQFERAHQNRNKIIRLIETQLRKKGAEQPAGAAAAAPPAAPQAAEELPFDGFDQLASSRRTESKRILEQRTPEELEQALAYEKANRNRVQIIRLIEAALTKAQQPAAATPAPAPAPAAAAQTADLPFPEYAQVASSKETLSRKILAPRSIEELEQALAFERTHQNRNKIINLIETQLRKKRGEAAPRGRAPQPPTDQLPFAEYAQVASSKQTESRAILNDQDIPTLERTLEFEQQTQNRRQVIGLIEATLRRKKGLGLRRAGEVPEGVQMPFPGFERVASSRQTESRHILAERSEQELEAALEFERTHQKRRQVEAMIEAALQRKRGGAPTRVRAPQPAPVADTDLPFPEYAQVASSKETQSRQILAARSEAELEQALAFERAHQNRNKVINLIETQLRKKRGEVTTGRKLAPAAAPAGEPAQAEPLPFPGYDQVASSKRTESRALLIGQTPETLRQARDYETRHQNRRQILDLIDTIIRQKESGTVRASKAGEEPVKNYDSIPANLILQSIRDGVFDAKLTQVLAYEQAHQNRDDVVQALQERMSGEETGPIVSPTGRQWKGKEPFRGYGSLDHSDRDALQRELSKRSSAELRRIEAAERRQDFPSQEAIEVANTLLAERSGQREAVPA